MSADGTQGNALPPGVELLWYAIDRVLGQGAFGITYLAQDANLHRQVAIKEYLPNQLARREGDGTVQPLGGELTDEFLSGRQRFIVEARTLARFEHPNIVRVHNVFEANGTAYLVMQYEEGEGLDRLLKRRGTLEEAELLAILHPLLDGLEVMHAQGYVHRDIKPANVFLRRDGAPVLLDFGSARQAVSGESRTLTNFVSPGYAPIEQYASRSDSQGAWSDVYGLAATMHRAMCGRAPVDAVERSQALAQDLADPYEPVRAHERYSAELLAAVDQALRFRALDRPRTVAAWRALLPPRPAATRPATTVRRDTAATTPDYVPTINATLPVTEMAGGTLPTVPQVRDAEVALASAPTTGDAPTTSGGTETETATSGFGWRHVLGLVAGVLALAVAAGAWLGSRMGEDVAPVASQSGTPAAATPANVPAPMADAAPGSHAVEGSAAAAAPNPLAPVAAPSAADRRVQRVAELLYGASQDLDALRLMSPPGQNAHEKYREVLGLDPANDAARRGIDAIADRYVGLAYRDIDARAFDRAANWLQRAEGLSPGRESVSEAQAALAAARASAAAPAAPAPVVETGAAPDDDAPRGRMHKFRKRFDAFVREQQEVQREQTRGDAFINRIGGGR